jgi:hypothetical protein
MPHLWINQRAFPPVKCAAYHRNGVRHAPFWCAPYSVLLCALRCFMHIEDDNTEYVVMVFDYRPVGYNGFMDCVTHSLALTDHGLFEVRRYSVVSLSAPGHYWQWFLHRRLATTEDVHYYCDRSKGEKIGQSVIKNMQVFAYLFL